MMFVALWTRISKDFWPSSVVSICGNRIGGWIPTHCDYPDEVQCNSAQKNKQAFLDFLAENENAGLKIKQTYSYTNRRPGLKGAWERK